MAAINETIKMLPPDARQEVVDFVEFMAQKYLKNPSKSNNSKGVILNFAGAWKDMTEKDYQDLINEVYERRQKLFKGRRKL
jgi:cell division GTPase FtsZ